MQQYCNQELFETPVEYTLHLIDIGPNKLQVLKLLCTLTGFTLAEVKRLTNICPIVLRESSCEAEIVEWNTALESAGAITSIANF